MDLVKRVLTGLVGFQSLSGIAGGIGLILYPTGAALGIPQEWLADTIFNTYLIPGIILFLVLGIFPAICFFALRNQKKWSVAASFWVGIALIIWILVEIFMIGYHSYPPLQLIYGILGTLIALFSGIHLANPTNK